MNNDFYLNSKKKKIKWYRCTIEREKLKKLSERSDLKGFYQAFGHITLWALTGTSVNYTPEGAFASYEKGQPVSVLLTLAFQELEPIYDTDYKYQGGDGERTSDTGEGYRWAIDKNEVGY